jgi:hypothetical protein
MKQTLTETERRYEEMLMARSGAERVRMACDMFDAARKLVIAGMPADQARDPRAVRRYVFLAFYGEEFTEAKRNKILEYLGLSLS